MPRHTRIVLLANPDNPSGTCMSGAEMRRLHAALPDNVLLIIDSAYEEFAELVRTVGDELCGQLLALDNEKHSDSSCDWWWVWSPWPWAPHSNQPPHRHSCCFAENSHFVWIDDAETVDGIVLGGVAPRLRRLV